MSLRNANNTARHWTSNGICMIGLLLFYFAIPTNADASTPRVLFGVTLTALGVSTVGYVIYRYVIESYRGDRDVITVANLLLVLEMVVVIFAFGYFILGTEATGQMAGIETRLDALYFTLVTLSTVGFGDIHAVGQLARGMVSVQIVFNLVLVGALVSITTGRIRPPSPASLELPDPEEK